ncbi:MAG: hypothetical protein WCC08_12160 [Terrimicrobiaceae bacterium]
MRPAKTIFAVPTYRLRDVAETVEIYDEPFRSNGHSVKTMVFDDSSVANHQKYFSLLEQTKTVNDLYYVGPTEKEQFIGFLNRKLRDRKLESLVRNLFRPSYRGNRNFTLMYTLGAFLMSADDDMRPHALIESSPESLETEEIRRGKRLPAAGGGFHKKSFDLLTAFHDVLGRKVNDLPANYEIAELAVHSVLASASATRDPQRRKALTLFAENLTRSFYGFEPDFFQQNVTRIVDDVVSVIHASLELWPTLVEICYFHKDKRDFPQLQVKNKRLKTRNGTASRSSLSDG